MSFLFGWFCFGEFVVFVLFSGYSDLGLFVWISLVCDLWILGFWVFWGTWNWYKTERLLILGFEVGFAARSLLFRILGGLWFFSCFLLVRTWVW